MKNELLRFPHKAIRAEVIKQYMKGKWDKAVCFSCGNAAEALQAAGIDTLHIGERGVLNPLKWFTQSEIKTMFPEYFDATSGHLPAELMIILGQAYKANLGKLEGTVYVPTGSGETVVCLKLAYPNTKFIAVYNLDKATEYSEECPLNAYVRIVCENVIMDGKAFANGQRTGNP